MKEEYAIKVENLVKNYKIGNKNYKKVFNDFDIKFERGKVHCLLGVSGCGKSSLLKVIAGIEEYDSGNIVFDDTYIKSNNIPLTMVLQENNLLPWLSVKQNIKFALDSIKKDINDKELKEILIRYDLYDIRNFYPHELSVGLKQKVALAKSIVINPKIILLDEPFCALDFISKENIHKIFLDEFATEKFTSILSTHYIEEAAKLGDYIHLMGKNNLYKKVKNPLKQPRDKDENYNKFIEYIKQVYIN